MRKSTALALSSLFLAASSAFAAPVTDWHTFRATTATVLAGQGTDDPIMGSVDVTSNNGFLVGYLPSSVSLVNVGDSITLSFKVRFNDAVGTVNGGDNFRFALFDLNGQAKVTNDNYATAGVDGQTDDWRGYWYGTKNGSGTGSGGSIRERTAALASGDNIFAAASPNNTSAPSLGAVGGTAVTLAGSVNGDDTGPTYTGVMTLTKTATGVDLSGSFSGTNSANANAFAVSDNSSPFPASYGAVGFLNGGGINTDQLLFEDVTVTYTPAPEPASLSLLAIGTLPLLSRRRRAH